MNNRFEDQFLNLIKLKENYQHPICIDLFTPRSVGATSVVMNFIYDNSTKFAAKSLIISPTQQMSRQVISNLLKFHFGEFQHPDHGKLIVSRTGALIRNVHVGELEHNLLDQHTPWNIVYVNQPLEIKPEAMKVISRLKHTYFFTETTAEFTYF
jgi:hypothetical protein